MGLLIGSILIIVSGIIQFGMAFEDRKAGIKVNLFSWIGPSLMVTGGAILLITAIARL